MSDLLTQQPSRRRLRSGTTSAKTDPFTELCRRSADTRCRWPAIRGGNIGWHAGMRKSSKRPHICDRLKGYIALLTRYLNIDGQLERACVTEQDLEVLRGMISYSSNIVAPEDEHLLVSFWCQLLNEIEISAEISRRAGDDELGPAAGFISSDFLINMGNHFIVSPTAPQTIQFANMCPPAEMGEPPILKPLERVPEFPKNVHLNRTDGRSWELEISTKDIFEEADQLILKMSNDSADGDPRYMVTLRIRWKGPSDQFGTALEHARRKMTDDFALLYKEADECENILGRAYLLPLYLRYNCDQVAASKGRVPWSDINDGERTMSSRDTLEVITQSMSVIKQRYSDFDCRNTPSIRQAFVERDETLMGRAAEVFDFVFRLESLVEPWRNIPVFPEGAKGDNARSGQRKNNVQITEVGDTADTGNMDTAVQDEQPELQSSNNLRSILVRHSGVSDDQLDQSSIRGDATKEKKRRRKKKLQKSANLQKFEDDQTYQAKTYKVRQDVPENVARQIREAGGRVVLMTAAEEQEMKESGFDQPHHVLLDDSE